jgi:multiple sugar transport system permease protein
MYTYALAFRLLQVGKASALGVITLLIVAGAIATMIMAVYRRERGTF